jgi:hypothetical protein
MGTKQLEMINKIVEKNLETTKKSQLPFFWAAFFWLLDLVYN